jgi:hypothetical protein
MRKYFLAAAMTLALLGQAEAQSVSRSLVWNGQSWTRGNTTSFSDGQGRFSGSAIRHGNSTSFYDGRGHYTGSVHQKRRPRR